MWSRLLGTQTKQESTKEVEGHWRDWVGPKETREIEGVIYYIILGMPRMTAKEKKARRISKRRTRMRRKNKETSQPAKNDTKLT